jgi:hypothetical protein
VRLFTTREWQDIRFLVRQLEAEIHLLDRALERRPATWLDDSE